MILKKWAGVFWSPVVVAASLLSAATSAQEALPRATDCVAVLTWPFVPHHPVLGRYEVCSDPQPLSEVAPTDSAVETVDPVEAFGVSGTVDRARLARLYAGRRPRVARWWRQGVDRFESLTLISPHPNSALTRLESGTLVIRWICDARDAACRPPDAR